jgi:hypothetical protein
MNNQKDTQKTNIDIYGTSNVSDNKSLNNMPIYDFANKKTEKLVTALYMVTDCMDTDDALKSKLRLLGVKLLSDMYELNTLSPMDKHIHIPVSLVHIYEILSFIEIAYTIGFISEMNTNILKKEFNLLASELKLYQTKDKHFTFTLDDKMFDVPSLSRSEDFVQTKQESIKDKRTTSNSMSFINNISPLEKLSNKKNNFIPTNLADREDRSKKILALIRGFNKGQIGKKSVNGNEVAISIKDISLSFTDCSEKTIQRELNALVLKGQLKKTGAKRWSRYMIGESSK